MKAHLYIKKTRMFAICQLAIVPVRAEASDRSELVTQLLFGEILTIIDRHEQWSKIEIYDDRYQGWIDAKQVIPISPSDYEALRSQPRIFNGDFVEYITNDKHSLLPICLGSSLSFLELPHLNTENFIFEGKRITQVYPKSNLLQTAFMYLNAPYLWGGKTPFGIDCSGFTQMVYKLNGYNIPRDASQQALVGEPLSFIEESEVGDLAFFDNEEGKIIHVGIIMQDNYIIHSHGKVRIDRIDHLGILNIDTGRHTHKLRVIKKII